MKRYHVSKNLFSGFTIGKGLNSTTGAQVNDTQAATSDYIEVDNTLSYTISGLDNNLRSFVNAYNADNQSLGRISATQREMVTFDSSSFIAGTPQGTGDIKYIRITQYKALDTQPDISDINNYTPMLNSGSTALPYEPYGNEWQTKSPPNYGTATDAVTNLPVTIFTDGQPVSSYTLKGNTTTSGTPSPSSPITINGVGNKTANLFDKASEIQAYYLDGTTGAYKSTSSTSRLALIPIEENTLYTFTAYSRTFRISFFDTTPVANQSPIEFYNLDYGTYGSHSNTFTSPIGAQYVAFFVYNSGTEASIYTENEIFNTVMVNQGSTALPYEPYGYKISISSNQTSLSPIYLSQPLRKSLDGTAFDTLDSTGLVTYNVDEYGQPQTATTETVTVPTITTTGGEVTIDVDTTVKPSELDLIYHGWHEHEPLKRENGQWS